MRNILILALLVLQLPGCASDNCTNGVPPFVLTLSSGGGFSGQATGTTIMADRSVINWRELRGSREEYVIGDISESEYSDLGRMIEQELDDTDVIRETGNMTSMLEVNRGGESLIFTWPGEHTDDSAVPLPLRGFVASVRKVLNRISQSEIDTLPRL